MRHTCNCGLSYRNPHDLDEHKRVGCRTESAKGESLIPEEDAPEEVEQEVPLEPELQEKESSQCQEPM
jgi:hypothetical protein